MTLCLPTGNGFAYLWSIPSTRKGERGCHGFPSLVVCDPTGRLTQKIEDVGRSINSNHRDARSNRRANPQTHFKCCTRKKVSERRESRRRQAGPYLSQDIYVLFASAVCGYLQAAVAGRRAWARTTWTGQGLASVRIGQQCQMFQRQPASALLFAPGATVQALTSKLNQESKSTVT